MGRKLIITVDTEGDNLWTWKSGNQISTGNTIFINRFQDLCEKHGFKPTYLTNYEMALDKRWVEYGKNKAKAGKCEIGLHIHAWNSPPIVELEDRYHGNSYITEYTDDIIQKKVTYLAELLRNVFEVPIISSRSGRWATNDMYYRALVNAGIKIDCSVTPEIDLSSIPGCSKNVGNDYSKYSKYPSEIYPGLYEIPMTTRKIRWGATGSFKHKVKSLLIGEEMWLRPLKLSMKYLKKIVEHTEKEHMDYLEFMLHSSELMPGGSPYFADEEDIEKLYAILDQFFGYLKEKEYVGYTLSEYYHNVKNV